MHSKQIKSSSTLVQLIVGFIIPTIILMLLSDPSKLGPLWAMLVALGFPVALEVYGLVRRRKPSLLSLFAIIGILLIGAISLLGLNEVWLAVRRSAFYVIAALALLFIVRFKPNVLQSILTKIIDMPAVHNAAKGKGVDERLTKHTARVMYLFAGLLLVIALASYILTIVFISAPTGSSEFNTQYAELRLLSLPAITLPLLVGVTVLLIYLVNGFEKMTGIPAESLLKKSGKQ